MTTIRRTALMLALTLTAVLGSAGSTAPAQASFADSASRSTAITTATIAAPTSVQGSLTCGRSSSTMAATWTRSTSARVTGQQVKVYFSDGFVQTVDLSATATSWSTTIDSYYVTAFSIRYSVTAKTDYSWFTESPLTGTFQC